jgi:hypothetical protein
MNVKRTHIRRGIRHSICALAAVFAVSTPAWANYSCQGTVDSLTVSPGTGVLILSTSSGLGAVYLCQLEGTYNSANGTVTPEQCKAFLAVLLSAQASRQQVQFSFNDALTCTTHPTWTWLTGWYYGPAVLAN